MDNGDRLRAAREARGITIGELAARLGVSASTVTLWENRKNRRQIATKHLPAVAEALGMPLSELLGEGQAPEPITATSLAETQLLRLFRLMPEKLQLTQLAQFIECASISGLDDTLRQGPRRHDVLHSDSR